MRRTVLSSPALIVAILMARVAHAQTPPTVIVASTAVRRIPADRASVVISVETRAATPAAAASENARLQKVVIARLAAAGLESRQISSSGYDVSESWRASVDDKVPTDKRFAASNVVRVAVTDLDKIGVYIDAALAAGATGVKGIEFTSTALDSARREALTAAISNARADATIMAKAAGGSLGKLLVVSTEPFVAPDASAFMGAGAAQTQYYALGSRRTTINPREVDVEVTVYTRWQLDPPSP